MLPSLFLTAALTLSLPPGAGSPVAEQIDEFATRLEGFGWSGSILLEVDGRTLLRKGYGLANRPGDLPYDGDTLFDIGSMAKTFTAAAVLRLQQDGRLALGDRIADHLTGVPSDKREITIEQLLTHTSGLTGDVPSSGDPHFDEVGRDEVVRRILATELEFPSGTDWS